MTGGITSRGIQPFNSQGRQARMKSALSAREYEVARELSGGWSTEEVARKCGISVFTMKYYMHMFYKKLHIASSNGNQRVLSTLLFSSHFGGTDIQLYVPNITVRNAQILDYVALGYTNAMIADETFITERTVKSHVTIATEAVDKRYSRRCAVALWWTNNEARVRAERGLPAGILRLPQR